MNKYTLLELVADCTGVTSDKICSKNRQKDIVRAKHLFFYFGRLYIGLRLTELANLVGCHHASVLHAIAKVNDLIEVDDEYYSGLFHIIRNKITADREMKLIVPYSVNLGELYLALSEFPEIRITDGSLDTEQHNKPDMLDGCASPETMRNS